MAFGNSKRCIRECVFVSPTCQVLLCAKQATGYPGNRSDNWQISWKNGFIRFILSRMMKPQFDPTPLYDYVTTEVTPLYLVECIHELITDYTRLLLAEVERNDPATDITAQTSRVLFELHRISICLLQGVRQQLESEEQSQKE